MRLCSARLLENALGATADPRGNLISPEQKCAKSYCSYVGD